MLMVLDAALAQNQRPSNVQTLIKALDTLALGFREGKHIIASAPATVTALLKVEGLQPSTRAVLLNIKERFPQLMALPAQFSSYAIISSDQAAPERKTIAGKDVVQIPISFFTDSSKIQPTVLLTEHLDDGETAKEMARFYRASAKLNKLPVRCELRCGAGSNMPAILNSIQDAKERFCLVLVDNDKTAPASAMGGTARAVTRVVRTTNWAMTSLLILDCKEMENAIPDDALCETFDNSINHRDSTQFLSRLSAECSNSRSYIDIKKGLSLGDIFNAPINSPERLFWESKVPMLDRISTLVSEHERSCRNFAQCNSPANCKCKFLLPNPGPFLNLINLVLEKWGVQQWRNLGDRCRNLWLTIGKFVFEWSCGWEFSSV